MNADGFEAEAIPGSKGQYDVIADGRLVFSKAETGRFPDVPILADALEEAGCTDVAILEHARKPRHYRGCWLIEAVLGRS